ncbi:MAG: hypothetical protein KDE24_16535 [Caldilinea sp.]|nr:hypothetical protein [Caldilinea sp.]
MDGLVKISSVDYPAEVYGDEPLIKAIFGASKHNFAALRETGQIDVHAIAHVGQTDYDKICFSVVFVPQAFMNEFADLMQRYAKEINELTDRFAGKAPEKSRGSAK